MAVYKYHLYHSEEECSKDDLAKNKLSEEQLDHEYDSLDTELHLFSRSKELDVTFIIHAHNKNGVVVEAQGLNSEQEADDFIGGFPAWTKRRGQTCFCPIIKKWSE